MSLEYVLVGFGLLNFEVDKHSKIRFPRVGDRRLFQEEQPLDFCCVFLRGTCRRAGAMKAAQIGATTNLMPPITFNPLRLNTARSGLQSTDKSVGV